MHRRGMKNREVVVLASQVTNDVVADYAESRGSDSLALVVDDEDGGNRSYNQY